VKSRTYGKLKHNNIHLGIVPFEGRELGSEIERLAPFEIRDVSIPSHNFCYRLLSCR